MSKRLKYSLFSASLFCFLLFLTGCDRLKAVDQKIGEFIAGEVLGGKMVDVPEPVAEVLTASTTIILKEQKEKIDKWLELNGYNRFGDPKDTFYSSGTPLFDEATGKLLERYEYILRKHPDVLLKI